MASYPVEAATVSPAAQAGAPGPHRRPTAPAPILTTLLVATLAIRAASSSSPDILEKTD